MKRVKGFTIIEALIALVFIGILVAFVAGAMNSSNSGSSVSFGLNGFTEIRCINGYLFTVDQNGSVRQVLNEFGKGARCNN